MMTCKFVFLVTPGGGLQHSSSRLLNASNSLCDNCAAVPFASPSDGSLGTGPAAATLWASRLSSSSATLFGSNFGVGGAGFFGGEGVLASAFLVSGFFAGSFASASAIGSGLGSALAGFESAGLVSAAGGGSRAALTSFFSTTLAVVSSTGLASPTFSAGGFGVSAIGASL